MELPLRNQELGPWTVDCLWPQDRLVVELDGRQHRRPAQATRDDDRDLWLRRHGYTIRRYGDKQLTHQPDAVIEDLLAAISYKNPIRFGGQYVANASPMTHELGTGPQKRLSSDAPRLSPMRKT